MASPRSFAGSIFAEDGGDGGIRTLDRPLQAYNGLANRRLQPLGHISNQADMPEVAATRKRQLGCRGIALLGRRRLATLRAIRWRGARPRVPFDQTRRNHLMPENADFLLPPRNGAESRRRQPRIYIYIECCASHHQRGSHTPRLPPRTSPLRLTRNHARVCFDSIIAVCATGKTLRSLAGADDGDEFGR